MNSFSSIAFMVSFLFVPVLTGHSLLAQQSSDHSEVEPITQRIESVTDVGAPILACATVMPPGSFLVAESFFKTYEYAYRRVAMLRANGFEHATLMHTDCQPVDVDGDYYFVAISQVVNNEEELYPFIDEAYRIPGPLGFRLINTRIVRAKK